MLKMIKKILNRSMNNKEISYQTAKQIINENQDTILLDVRSKQEYEEGHLPGSVSLCLYDIEEKAPNLLTDKKQTIITYCSSGGRSKEAQEMLEAMGYENVYSLKGGLDSLN